MLSWNEIRHRAIAFSRDWKGTTSEKSERQTFWNAFFDIFGIKRRAVYSFEEPVRKLSSNWGYIDLFWPARVLIEHKSAGQCLAKAHADLDRAVDRCYRKETFLTDRQRVEYLFALYEQLTAPLAKVGNKRK
jgi:hypothetical protein